MTKEEFEDAESICVKRPDHMPSPVKPKVSKPSLYVSNQAHVPNDKNPNWFRCPRACEMLQESEKFDTLEDLQAKLNKVNQVFGSDSHQTVFNVKEGKNRPKYVQVKCILSACPFNAWYSYD